MRYYLITLILFAVSAAPAGAAYFWQAPLLTGPTDLAVFLVHEPSAPEVATWKQDRTVAIGDLRDTVLTIRQGADEPDTTPKLRIYDKSGKLRTTIFADGGIEIQ